VLARSTQGDYFVSRPSGKTSNFFISPPLLEYCCTKLMLYFALGLGLSNILPCCKLARTWCGAFSGLRYLLAGKCTHAAAYVLLNETWHYLSHSTSGLQKFGVYTIMLKTLSLDNFCPIIETSKRICHVLAATRKALSSGMDCVGSLDDSHGLRSI